MSTLQLGYKLLYDDSKAPIRATKGSAGLDLTVRKVEQIGKKTWKVYSGVAFDIPSGYFLDLRARSSIHKKTAKLANGAGVIDWDYTGEVCGVFYCEDKPYAIEERFCQLILMELPKYELIEVKTLKTTERGSGGFGSTDKKQGFSGFKTIEGNEIYFDDYVYLVAPNGVQKNEKFSVRSNFELWSLEDGRSLSMHDLHAKGHEFILTKP